MHNKSYLDYISLILCTSRSVKNKSERSQRSSHTLLPNQVTDNSLSVEWSYPIYETTNQIHRLSIYWVALERDNSMEYAGR